MEDLISRLARIEQGKWNLHEKVLCRRLRITVKEGLSVRSQLTQLIVALKKGGWVDFATGSWKKTGFDVMDLSNSSTPNPFSICYVNHGTREEFATDSLSKTSVVKASPRYFTIGDNAVSVSDQMIVLKAVMGENKKLPHEVQQRRSRTWKGWHENDKENGGTSFERHDLPEIARTFPTIWTDPILIPSKKLDSRTLKSVGKDIRTLLVACNKVTLSPETAEPQLVVPVRPSCQFQLIHKKQQEIP